MRVMMRGFIFNMFPISSQKTSLEPNDGTAEVSAARDSCSGEKRFDLGPVVVGTAFDREAVILDK